MAISKPKLSSADLVLHLENKGVLFNIINKEDAKTYLDQNNNYYKLAAYRKNYSKHPDGLNKGKYINLEFAYLVDLAIIDMRLRYQIVHISLDLEHHTKLHLLRMIDINGEDGYQIVQDYIKSLSPDQRISHDSEIKRSKHSVYCEGIVNKYNGAYPIWAYIEIISFGRLIDFYKFCAKRFSDKYMLDVHYNLLSCKKIRNAAAHNNCILNDLASGTAVNNTNSSIAKELSAINGLNSNFRKNRMGNVRIQQFVTLLYMHKELVKSSGLRHSECEELHALLERMFKHIDYYKDNNMVLGTFNFLKIVIDNWFNLV